MFYQDESMSTFFSDVLGMFSIIYVVAESLSMPLDTDKNDNSSPIVEQLWKFLQLSMSKFPCSLHVAGSNIVHNAQEMLMVGLEVVKSINFNTESSKVELVYLQLWPFHAIDCCDYRKIKLLVPNA